MGGGVAYTVQRAFALVIGLIVMAIYNYAVAHHYATTHPPQLEIPPIPPHDNNSNNSNNKTPGFVIVDLSSLVVRNMHHSNDHAADMMIIMNCEICIEDVLEGE
jgi:hypothetical protein